MIKTVDLLESGVSEKLVESFRDTGFAIIENASINYDVIKNCYKAWQGYFESPDKNYLYDQTTGAGWVTLDRSEKAKGASVTDMKEFYHFYYDRPCPEPLRDITSQTFEQLFKLASSILIMLESACPEEIRSKLSRPLEAMISRQNTLFRIIHYPPMGQCFKPKALRAAPHEDINLITILPADTAEGLEVLDQQNNWVPIKFKPNQCVLNIGDMLQECTDGYFKSTKHRVVNPEDKDESRYSMPLFLHPHDDVVLSKRYIAREYLSERLKEIGLEKA